MEGLLVILGFLLLFMLGFPVVLAIAIPCLVYVFCNGLPLDLLAQVNKDFPEWAKYIEQIRAVK